MANIFLRIHSGLHFHYFIQGRICQIIVADLTGNSLTRTDFAPRWRSRSAESRHDTFCQAAAPFLLALIKFASGSASAITRSPLHRPCPQIKGRRTRSAHAWVDDRCLNNGCAAFLLQGIICALKTLLEL